MKRFTKRFTQRFTSLVVESLGTELAAFYIEARARQFAAVTRAIAHELGVKVSDIFARAS